MCFCAHLPPMQMATALPFLPSHLQQRPMVRSPPAQITHRRITRFDGADGWKSSVLTMTWSCPRSGAGVPADEPGGPPGPTGLSSSARDPGPRAMNTPLGLCFSTKSSAIALANFLTVRN